MGAAAPGAGGRPFPAGPMVASEHLAGVVCLAVDLASGPEAWREAALPWVTGAERARAGRYRQRLDGTRHLVGRALVRRVLAVPVQAFTENPWGKPSWPGSGVEFSLAHSGSWIWAAFCRDAAVGIDVEIPGADLDTRTLGAILHPGEQEELAGLPEAAFLRCWTRKEAVLKALGEGLARPLPSFQVRAGGPGRDWLVQPPATDAAGWTSADLEEPGPALVSVAAMAPGLAVTWQFLPDFD